MANQSISNTWKSYLPTEGFQLCLCDESFSFSDILSTMPLILRSSHSKKLSASVYVKEGKDLCISRGMHHVEDANTLRPMLQPGQIAHSSLLYQQHKAFLWEFRRICWLSFWRFFSTYDPFSPIVESMSCVRQRQAFIIVEPHFWSISVSLVTHHSNGRHGCRATTGWNKYYEFFLLSFFGFILPSKYIFFSNWIFQTWNISGFLLLLFWISGLSASNHTSVS